jgi:NarL family two-component system response regulator YdfI
MDGYHRLWVTKPVLTERQLQILQLVAHGATYKKVGLQLGTSEGSIKTHLTHVRERLNVDSTLEAAFICYKAGLIK